MKRSILGGVRKQGETFAIDYSLDEPNDIIKLVPPTFYTSSKNNHIYWFGYAFDPNCSSNDRTEFIKYLKQLGDNKITDTELEKFIQLPLQTLRQYVSSYNIDCFVYPISSKSPLVPKIIRAMNSMASRESAKCTFEFVKQAPTDITFDWETFDSENEAKQGYKDMCKYIEQVLMPSINELDYFSLARNVKSKYRPYIEGFLNFKDAASIEKYSKLKGANVLVVDDINTTGSTLDEILRVLDKVNSNCNIFIYTLIGK